MLQEKIFEEFGSFSNAQELYDLDRRTIEQDYNKYVKSLTDAGSEDIATEERYYDLVKKENYQSLNHLKLMYLLRKVNLLAYLNKLKT